MWASKQFLEKCQKLKGIYFLGPISEGDRIGRGFADLGAEEFLVLPNKKLLSLFSGTVTELPEEDERHFFRIPSVDELIAEIQRTGAKINSINFLDQRDWEVSLVASSGSEVVVKERRLDEVLLTGLCLLIKV